MEVTMGEEVRIHDSNNTTPFENTFSIKQELDDDVICLDDEGCVFSETTFSTNHIQVNNAEKDSKLNQNKGSSIKIINEELSSARLNNTAVDSDKIENKNNGIGDIQIECDNGLLFCDPCEAYYEDYCIECRMLVYVLNDNTPNNTHNNGRVGLPKDILEITDLFEQLGIFALKIIPENIRFGPFTGLSSSSEYSWKLKEGKFIVPQYKSKLLNWMQYVNPARNSYEQNLLAFQCEDNIYYRTTRQIQAGEELLVYFSEQYEDILNKDLEIDFVPITEEKDTSVFACSFCCLGFSSELHLTKHKTVCQNEANEKFSSIKELTQCSFCKIHLVKEEYQEYHMNCCSEKRIRKTILMSSDNSKIEIERDRKRKLTMYRCIRCNYKTIYKLHLKDHLNEHCELQPYWCESCHKCFKTRPLLNMHVQNVHVNGEENRNHTDSLNDSENIEIEARYRDKWEVCESTPSKKFLLQTEARHVPEVKYKCQFCEYNTIENDDLQRHTKANHLKQLDYTCDFCKYKTNEKLDLEKHTKEIHLPELNYKCVSCLYRTNQKEHLERHIIEKHPKKFDYKCNYCKYKTNEKLDLEKHTKERHTPDLKYKCKSCLYRTNQKEDLEQHRKTKHFRYKCESCDFRARRIKSLKAHIKTRHLKEFDHQCEECEFQTNCKKSLRSHIKVKHLNQHDYKCEICDYKTNDKPHLERHRKSKHFKEFDYKCEHCKYKTNSTASFNKHRRTKCYQDFKYKCETCDYKTQQKSLLENHRKSVHVQEFDYKCENCKYKTNNKVYFERHRIRASCQDIIYECESCEYKTSQKGHLVKHTKTKHLKEFDYKCVTCNFNTNYKHHLDNHIKVKHCPEFNKCD